MALIVEEEDNRFRVCWQEYSIGWHEAHGTEHQGILLAGRQRDLCILCHKM